MFFKDIKYYLNSGLVGCRGLQGSEGEVGVGVNRNKILGLFGGDFHDNVEPEILSLYCNGTDIETVRSHQ